MKEWIYPTDHPDLSRPIAEEFDIPVFLAEMLIRRGYDDPQKIRSFLSPDNSLLRDPFLMKDMDRAVRRIRQAIRNGETVTVYGDYDVDGITSTALLYLFLKETGVTVHYFIPDRISEGYGIHADAVRKISENSSTLIISVDTGITACEEAEYAKTLGIDFVITDHHECGEIIPDAAAVCNPKREDCPYPFKCLAGVGVVFKLICALCCDTPPDVLLDRFGDLVALGTVADVMPLIGENRYIVKKGLSVLGKNKQGLQTLMRLSGVRNPEKLSVFDISFLLAPRINAAGRIGDPLRAVELLITDQEETQISIAEYLCTLNNKRQQIESVIFEEAEQIIFEKRLYRQRSIVLWKEGWHNGVIGIVASRIKEKYGLPTILFSVTGKSAKGSGRSIEPVNLYNAFSRIDLPSAKFGGHAMAAGITIDTEDLPKFAAEFESVVKSITDQTPFVNTVTIDAILTEKDLTLPAFRSVFLLEPFGTQNETPMFCAQSVCIRNVTPIGNNKHLKLLLQAGGKTISAVYFGISAEQFGHSIGEYVDVLFQASVNEFRGNVDIQMIVRSVRSYKRKFESQLQEIDQIRKRDFSDLSAPTRQEIAAVYRFCRAELKENRCLWEQILLPNFLVKSGYGRFSLPTVLLSLLVLRDIGVLEYGTPDDNILLLGINETKKASIESSETYKKLLK